MHIFTRTHNDVPVKMKLLMDTGLAMPASYLPHFSWHSPRSLFPGRGFLPAYGGATVKQSLALKIGCILVGNQSHSFPFGYGSVKYRPLPQVLGKNKPETPKYSPEEKSSLNLKGTVCLLFLWQLTFTFCIDIRTPRRKLQLHKRDDTEFWTFCGKRQNVVFQVDDRYFKQSSFICDRK